MKIKKLLATLLATIMVLGSSMTAFAENQTATEAGGKNVTVTATAESAFEVTLPLTVNLTKQAETVTLSGGGSVPLYKATANVTVSGSIPVNKAIMVEAPTAAVTLTGATESEAGQGDYPEAHFFVGKTGDDVDGDEHAFDTNAEIISFLESGETAVSRRGAFYSGADLAAAAASGTAVSKTFVFASGDIVTADTYTGNATFEISCFTMGS